MEARMKRSQESVHSPNASVGKDYEAMSEDYQLVRAYQILNYVVTTKVPIIVWFVETFLESELARLEVNIQAIMDSDIQRVKKDGKKSFALALQRIKEGGQLKGEA